MNAFPGIFSIVVEQRHKRRGRKYAARRAAFSLLSLTQKHMQWPPLEQRKRAMFDTTLNHILTLAILYTLY